MLTSLLLRQAAAAATTSSRCCRHPNVRLLLRQQGAMAAAAAVAVAPFSSSSTTTSKAKAATSGKKTAPKKAGAAATPPPPPAAAPPKTATTTTTTGTTAAQKLVSLSQELPHLDVVRYTHKNRTWTLQHVHYYSEALAIGLMENGFQAGDVVLSYLPSHFSEQMVLQFACSKAGLILYSLDPTLATTDKEAAKQALASALTLSQANILISQEAGDDVNYISLAHSVIPELRVYNATSGMPFITPRFPHLRLCIHAGMDQDDMKYGWLPLRQMVVPSDNLNNYVTPQQITPKTPLAGSFQLDAKGIPTAVGATLTNEQVLEQENLWPTFAAILKKQYHTVEGVGVVF